MNLFKYFFSVSIVSIKVFSCDISEVQPFQFKIGLEFQNSDKLCSWTQYLKSEEKRFIDKNDIFIIWDESKDQEIFSIHIDDRDIEFITRPFSNLVLLQNTIDNIASSFECLANASITEEAAGPSFESWYNALKEYFSARLEVKEKSYNFVKDKFIFSRFDLLEPAEKFSLSFLNFQPQLTIQHPLEYTIPIYRKLFGLPSQTTTSAEFSIILKDLDRLANSHDSQIRPKYLGLIFLYTVSLYCLSSENYTNDLDQCDIIWLKEDSN